MAEAADVATLARKLRGKGQSDAQVVEGLRGLGFSKAESQQALSDLGPTAPPPATPQPPKPGSGRKGPENTPKQAPPAASPAAPGIPKISAPDVSNITLTPPKKISGGDVGGFLAGLLIYTLALNFIRYGPEGVRGWLAAKFINQPMDVPLPGGSGGGSGGRSWGNKPAAPVVVAAKVTTPTGLTSTRPAPPSTV